MHSTSRIHDACYYNAPRPSRYWLLLRSISPVSLCNCNMSAWLEVRINTRLSSYSRRSSRRGSSVVLRLSEKHGKADFDIRIITHQTVAANGLNAAPGCRLGNPGRVSVTGIEREDFLEVGGRISNILSIAVLRSPGRALKVSNTAPSVQPNRRRNRGPEKEK